MVNASEKRHLLVFVISLCCALSSLALFERTGSAISYRLKRVVHGTPMTVRKVGFFDAVEYIVWIGNGHCCDAWWKRLAKAFKPDDSCPPTTANLVCGGSPVTGDIVLTHCLARSDGAVKERFILPVVKNEWEHPYHVFGGQTQIEFMDRPVQTKKFVIHENFAQLVDYPNWMTHDYGWMILSEKVNLISLWTSQPIRYSPVYNLNSFLRIYEETIGKQSVCLYMGFGVYEEGKPKNYSPILRYGWQITLDYKTCYYSTITWYGKEGHFNYTKYGTWSFLGGHQVL